MRKSTKATAKATASQANGDRSKDRREGSKGSGEDDESSRREG